MISMKRRERRDNYKNDYLTHQRTYFRTDADFEPPFLMKLHEIRKLFELTTNTVGRKNLDMFDFEFESYKNWGFYFPNFNLNEMIAKYKNYLRILERRKLKKKISENQKKIRKILN